MNSKDLKNIIREELKQALTEKYQDQYKMKGVLVTNIQTRPQNEILSDIRSITGVTVVSTTEIENYSEQNFNTFTTILNIKIDGYPFIKSGGFSRDKIGDIVKNIQNIPDVVSFKFKPEDIYAT
tara:strand:+ start:1391 stop:1762 length:372 start_codon:yes stop_codon:yes gene_type:complete